MSKADGLVIEYLSVKAERQELQSREVELFTELQELAEAIDAKRSAVRAGGHVLTFKARENIRVDASAAASAYSSFLTNEDLGSEAYPFKLAYQVSKAKLEHLKEHHFDFYREHVAPALSVAPGKATLEIVKE